MAHEVQGMHGVVEGFYGRPWTHAQRMSLVRFVGAIGLDTYLFGPKNDPSHRGAFAEPLSSATLSELAEVVEVARASGVRFVYGVSPERLVGGGDLVFRGDRTRKHPLFRALVGKLASLVRLGIQDFALFFDDTWPTLAPWLASFAIGERHARLVEALVVALGDEAGVAPTMLVVPAVYFGTASGLSRGARQYLSGLGSRGPLRTAWTGPRIFSSFISGAEIRALARETNLSPWVWNNVIANDWLPLATGEPLRMRPRERLSFGPVDNLGTDVIGAASGILLNGAREAELTKISLATLAAFVRAPFAYHPYAAHDAAIRAVLGADAAEDTSMLFELVQNHPMVTPTGAEASTFRDFTARARRGHATDLERLLTRLAEIDRRLAQTLARHPALEELRPTAEKIANAARALGASARGDLPSARTWAKAAMASRWSTALDPSLADAMRGRFPGTS
ncbi:MAG: beta-N-acetylglucosaminidase domain-containing protein [Polyangiaceae bacterium]